MLNIKSVHYIIYSEDPDNTGYLYRDTSGNYGINPDPLQAKFFYDKLESDVVREHWEHKLGITLYSKRVSLRMSEKLDKSFTLDVYDYNAVRSVYMGLVRRDRELTTILPEEEKVLVDGAVTILKLLGNLYKSQNKINPDFVKHYKGYHIVGIPKITSYTNAIQVRDYSATNPQGYEVIKEYTYPTSIPDKKVNRLRKAMILIDQLVTEYNNKKDLKLK